MAITHEVALRLADGTTLDVFDEYDIKLSMLEPGNPFTFKCWASTAARSSWDYLMDNVKCGDRVTLLIDGAPQLVGEIETHFPYADEKGATITLSGRDLIGPAQSFDVSPQLAFKDTTLEAALEEILKESGLDVRVGVDAATITSVQTGARKGNATGASRVSRKQKVDQFRPEIGQKQWECAKRLCRRHGLMLWPAPWDTETMAVIVDRPAYDAKPLYQFTRRFEGGTRNVTQDSNILGGGPRTSTQGIPTDVYLHGHAKRGATTAARVTANATNDRWDPQFVRLPMPKRSLHARYISGRGFGNTSQQAQRHIDDAMSKHATYECTVQGHGQKTPRGTLLYAINTVARVRDDKCRVDRSYLIDTVNLSRARESDRGTLTRLNMHSLNAIVLIPDPEA